MSEPPAVEIRTHLDAVFRAESGRILATLIRLLGSFDGQAGVDWYFFN